jgi:hypothetical protein
MNYTPIFNTSDFYGVFYWVKEIIDKQNSNTKNNEKWKMKKSRSKFLKIVDEKHDINFHWPNNIFYYIHFEINGVSWNLIGSQECDFSTNRTAIRAEIALLWTNHIRVLTSANQSYLIMGFKQPIKFNKNVLWQMSTKTKNLHMSWMIYCKIKQFFAHKNKLIWIAKVNYQRIANFANSNRKIKNIIFYQIWSKRQQKQI